MDSQKVSIRRTKKKGRGIYADKDIRKGEFIAIFDGPIYDGEVEWTEDMYNHAIQFDKDLWRDSVGIARLINHSCDPNCGIKDLFKVVAMRKIKADEEISWDYEMTEKNPHWKMKCQCGTNICRGIIGNYKNMPKSIRKKYGTYISAWLTQKK
ncbi:MAG: SET domain-containing protein [Bdellovibrionaceae bacterium]|nr:SET domain-containing protein [Pseudobdellovibrionaceae bacterium]